MEAICRESTLCASMVWVQHPVVGRCKKMRDFQICSSSLAPCKSAGAMSTPRQKAYRCTWLVILEISAPIYGCFSVACLSGGWKAGQQASLYSKRWSAERNDDAEQQREERRAAKRQRIQIWIQNQEEEEGRAHTRQHHASYRYTPNPERTYLTPYESGSGNRLLRDEERGRGREIKSNLPVFVLSAVLVKYIFF